jgi:hypothetical protein
METSRVTATAPQVAIDTGTPTPSGTAGPTPLLPEPGGGDVGVDIAMMVIENAFTRRDAARRDRQQETLDMARTQNAQLSHMREAADKRYAAAMLEGAAKIAEGAGTCASGVVKLAHHNDWENVAAGAGKHDSGVLGLFATTIKHDADRSDVAAKRAEMEASLQKAGIEHSDDEAKEARQHLQNAIDFLKEFRATEAKSMSSAIRA